MSAGRLARAALLVALIATPAHAQGWLAPGDASLRDDIERLVDESVINLPLLAWPIHSDAISEALDGIAGDAKLTVSQQAAVDRLRRRLVPDQPARFWAGGTNRPGPVRTFSGGPRSDVELGVHAEAQSDGWSARVNLTIAADPSDGQSFRPDGSYVSGRVGNWAVTAGWLERWWGPGWDGSLILGTAARPVPAISIDRAVTTPFETRWLHWMGPWTINAFVGAMEQHREDLDHPLLMGMRASFRPLNGLEISLERTAQWCAESLPCDLQAFWDVLVGHDNYGENVDAAREPGNQLFGYSWRWSSPIGSWPYAFYSQTTGEAGTQSSPTRPVSRLSLQGLEIWGGSEGGIPWRLYFEYAETTCQDGGGSYPDCAYNHHLFDVEGYRYRGEPVGHPLDGDGRMYSLGLQLRGAFGADWQFLARRLEINRVGVVPDTRHTLSPEPLDAWEGQARADFDALGGRFAAGLAAEYLQPLSGRNETKGRAFVTYSRSF
jgi:hypothetical protein